MKEEGIILVEARSSRRPHVLRGILAVTLPVMVLMATVSPASAQVEAAPTGVQTHLGVPYQPNPPCARYSTYDANVTFPNSGGTPYNVTVAKDPTRGDQFWDENPQGTYKATNGGQVPIPPPPDGCPGTAGATIQGFLVTVVGQDPSTGTAYNCVNATASYRRDVLNITISEITPVPGGTCPPSPIRYQIAAVYSTSLPPPLNFVALCDGPASRICVIGPTVTIP